MKLKTILAIIASVVLLIGAIVAGIYYYYNDVEEINDYFLVSVSESQEDLFGKLQAPKIEITQEQNWGNDSLEIVRVTSMVKGKYKFAAKKLVELKRPTEGVELLKYYAEKEVLMDIISAQHTLVCFRHVRSYDAKDLLETLKKSNGDLSKINDYVKNKKVSIHFYSISPF